MPTLGTAISYTSYDRASLSLNPWSGRNIALLIQSSTADPLIVSRIVNAIDAAWDAYRFITGREPSLFLNYQGLASIAHVPTTFGTNGGALGYLGFTGIELSDAVFQRLYTDALTNTYDQAVFYELGRNFWFYGRQLGIVDPFVTGFAIANRFVSMEVAGLTGSPFNGTLAFPEFKLSIMEDLAQTFFGTASYTLANTLASNVGVANSRGWGSADLAASLINQVYEDFGLNEYSAFYRALALQPQATNSAGAFANFIAAATAATGIDYSFINKPVGTAYQVGGRSGDTMTAAGVGVIMMGFGGADVLTGSSGRDQIFGDIGDDVLRGEGGADDLVGGRGNDILFGGDGDDRLMGGDGNDLLTGGTGNDRLNGGAGYDTANFGGVRRQYGASSISVAGGPEGGTDTLVSIEELRFVDGVLSFDVNGIAAQVMRLYDATLDRQPDQAGLDVQIRALASGVTTLQALANAFVASGEFQSRYGTLSNQQFVEQLYRFCLDREGDAAGIAVQVNALNTGTSRAALVVAFSESTEHRTLTQPILNGGLWVADEKALQIARLYDATLDRLPDAAGLAGQLAALNGGTSLLQLASNFVGSAEFQARYGALSNQQFVEQLYRFCLDREGDAAGIAAQVNALNSGTSRAQLVLAFSESAEHVALTAPLYSGGIRTSDPAFSAAQLQDGADKALNDQPQVLIPGDGAPQVIKADEAQVLPGTVNYDPAQIVVGFKLVDDFFVLPPQDELTPLVLPQADLLETVALEQVSLPQLTGDRMLTLPMSDHGTPDDATAWHRGTDTDGWMMQ